MAALVWHLSYFAPYWIGSWQLPFSRGVEALSSARQVPAALLLLLSDAIRMALTNLFVLTLYRILARVDWLAVLLLIVTNIVFNLWWYGGGNVWLHVTFLALIMSIAVVVLVRFGLLALAAHFFFFFALQSLPIALDLGAWYAGYALLALGLLAAVAVVAFHVSLAGRPALGGRLLEE